MSLFAELKRRNVFRVGIAYAVAAWLLLQLAEVLSELLNLPEQLGPIVVTIVVIGFPIVLLAAWAYELTPQGLKREAEVDRSQPIRGHTGSRLNVMISVMLAIAVTYLLYDKFLLRNAPDTPAVIAETLTDSGTDPTGSADQLDGDGENPATLPRQSIAVLPFENRSRLEDDEFFVDGIHDDLLTNLARIGGLKVISRTSVNQYADTTKPIAQIAEELGVGTIMEGAVQRAGDTVRINVQLIDAGTDEHLWAEIFDREMTAENLFAIQSEISGQIAQALQATVSPEEERRINKRPTDNLAAYNAFLRGRQLQARRNTVQLEEAMGEYRRAAELDPNFAQAWVGIAETATLLTTWGTLPREERNRIRTEAAARAIELAPELGEAWLAHAMVAPNREEAEARYQKAIELSPGYATSYQWYANEIQFDFRRRREAQDLFEKAVELDPLSPILRDQAAWNLAEMGYHDIAERQLRSLLTEDPDFAPALVHLAQTRMQQGDFLEAAQLFRRTAVLDPGTPTPLTNLMMVYSAIGYTDGLSELRDRLSALSEDIPLIGMMDTMIAQSEGRLDAALEHLKWVEQRMGPAPFLKEMEGAIRTEQGDFMAAREAFETAFPRVFDEAAWTRLPDGSLRNLQSLCFAGYIMTQSGDPEAGRARIQAGLDYALNELPRHVTRRISTGVIAQCQLVNGNIEATVDALEAAAEMGDLTWVPFFRLNRGPLFEPIRNHPRFREVYLAAEAEVERQREQLAALDAEAGT